jgi:hypothetical protein
LLELRGTADLRIAEKFFAQPEQLKEWCADHHIRFGCDLHMTADAACFQPAGVGGLILHEGKTFHQYTDLWHAKPRYSVAPGSAKPMTGRASQYYRLAFRDIARSNDERTMIAFIAPPGTVFGHTATVEKSPWARTNADALVLCALFNSFAFDWLVRQKAATHLSLYILDALPVPSFSAAARHFLAQGALRLSCNHAEYKDLWRQQTGRKLMSPTADDKETRSALRAQIDAVVARSYKLDRDQYAHVLGSFIQQSSAAATALWLGAFDDAMPNGPSARDGGQSLPAKLMPASRSPSTPPNRD